MQFSIPSFPKLALMLSVAGLLAGLGVSYMATPRYESSAVLQVNDRGGPAARRQIQAIEATVLSRTSLSTLIQTPHLELYPADMAKLPLEDVIENMRRDIRIAMAPNNTGAFTISFTYPDRLKAQATVQELITRFYRENRTIGVENPFRPPVPSEERQLIAQLESRIAALEHRVGIAPSHAPGTAVAPLETFEVLDPPSLPVNPLYPKRSMFASTGFVAGFALAIVITIFRRRFQPAAALPASIA